VGRNFETNPEVHDLPVLHDLAGFDAADHDSLRGPAVAGGFDASKRAGVTTATAEACDNQIPFGHLLFDNGASIPGSVNPRCTEPPFPLRPHHSRPSNRR
jgi:hypothetical protein